MGRDLSDAAEDVVDAFKEAESEGEGIGRGDYYVVPFDAWSAMQQAIGALEDADDDWPLRRAAVVAALDAIRGDDPNLAIELLSDVVDEDGDLDELANEIATETQRAARKLIDVVTSCYEGLEIVASVPAELRAAVDGLERLIPPTVKP
jgi:uncharacterized protein (UPF0147 family)